MGTQYSIVRARGVGTHKAITATQPGESRRGSVVNGTQPKLEQRERNGWGL